MKKKTKPAPSTVVPCEWTQGNARYVANGSPLIGYWLRCWRGGKLVSAVWYADAGEIIEAIQEAKRS